MGHGFRLIRCEHVQQHVGIVTGGIQAFRTWLRLQLSVFENRIANRDTFVADVDLLKIARRRNQFTDNVLVFVLCSLAPRSQGDCYFADHLSR